MKKYLILIILQITYTTIFAQVFCVSADKNNVVYIGVDNPLSIVVEKYTADQLEVTADKGVISASFGRFYIYRAVEPGIITITLSDKITSKEIGKYFFRAKYIPDPVAKLDTSGGGKLSRSVLITRQAIRAVLENFDFDLFIHIESFTVDIIKKDSCSFKEIINKGNKFNTELMEALKTTRQDDMVIFKEIYVKFPDGRNKFIQPVVFFVTE